MLHTCLRVENLEKSIAFYQDAFGFKRIGVAEIFQNMPSPLFI